MAEQSKQIEVVIKRNKYARYAACSICGADKQLAVGPCLFEEGSWYVVCDECASQHAPGLLAMLTTTDAQTAYWAAEQDEAIRRERKAGASKLAELQTQLEALQGQVAATEAQIETLAEEAD